MIVYYNVEKDKTAVVGEKMVHLTRYEMEKRGYRPIVSLNASWDSVEAVVGSAKVTPIDNHTRARAWLKAVPLTASAELQLLKTQMKKLMEKKDA